MDGSYDWWGVGHHASLPAKTPPERMSLDEILHYLRLGGVTLAILIASSLLALGVALERLLALWNLGGATRELAATVQKHLSRGDLSAARSSAERSEALSSDIFLTGIDRAARGANEKALGTAVERERVQLSLTMRKNLWILGTIGATAPFVGLFGTVAGIMTSFKDLGLDVQSGGTGGSAAVMEGISEALIVTAVGILVAVQAVILYNAFQARLGRLAVEIRLIVEEFVEQLREAQQGSHGGATAAVVTPESSRTPATEER